MSFPHSLQSFMDIITSLKVFGFLKFSFDPYTVLYYLHFFFFKNLFYWVPFPLFLWFVSHVSIPGIVSVGGTVNRTVALCGWPIKTWNYSVSVFTLDWAKWPNEALIAIITSGWIQQEQSCWALSETLRLIIKNTHLINFLYLYLSHSICHQVLSVYLGNKSLKFMNFHQCLPSSPWPNHIPCLPRILQVFFTHSLGYPPVGLFSTISHSPPKCKFNPVSFLPISPEQSF